MLISLLCIGFILYALVTMNDNNKLKESMVNRLVPVPPRMAQLGTYNAAVIAIGQLSTLIPAIIATIWYILADETRLLMLAAAVMLWLATYSWVTMVRAAYFSFVRNDNHPI